MNDRNLFDVQVEHPKNDQSKKASIPQVSPLNELKFYGDRIFANRYSGIGVGKEMEEQYWKGKVSNVRLIIEEEFPYPTSESCTERSALNCVHHIGTGAQLFCEEELTDDQQETGDRGETVMVPNIIEHEDTLIHEEEKNYYECPEPVCVAQFSKLGNLQRNIIVGNHNSIRERKTVRDFALGNFRVNVAGDAENQIRLQEPIEEIVRDLRTIKDQEYVLPPQGWTMKETRMIQYFSEKLKAYLNTAFNRGAKKKNEKVNARALAI